MRFRIPWWSAAVQWVVFAVTSQMPIKGGFPVWLAWTLRLDIPVIVTLLWLCGYVLDRRRQ